jgi:hypothetical protein
LHQLPSAHFSRPYETSHVSKAAVAQVGLTRIAALAIWPAFEANRHVAGTVTALPATCDVNPLLKAAPANSTPTPAIFVTCPEPVSATLAGNVNGNAAADAHVENTRHKKPNRQRIMTPYLS